MSQRKKKWRKDVRAEFSQMQFDEPNTRQSVTDVIVSKRFIREARKLQTLHDEAIASRHPEGGFTI